MTAIGETFRSLHVPGDPLVMINVWDRGTAKMMAALGAKALATSSAAHAYLMGKPDGGDVSRDDALAHAQEIVSATALPVQGDFENGFGDDPDTCAETVRLSAEIGLAGICIEDTMFPSGDAYAFDLTVERIKAAVSAARALPQDFVLTARADGVLTGRYDVDEAFRRLQAFEKVGADCLYAPLLPDMDAVRRVTSTLSKPVNVLAVGRMGKETRATLGDAGVARISIGSALARTTQRVMHDLGQSMIEDGDFTGLKQTISSDIVDKMLTGQS
ncbi:2-Methylisocitrate lyase, PEP mutase family [Cognatiyoonia sediminum]|uniref:2-Methylisocitrate lyase, PEP mutase family n=1 Tax=Cognatiyoonia sediminum TaxID=1508389 RepID=A0A1M5LNW2_9RHOB|nr:isocitrate lyase/phosphoenolpyruvate mutase family protein [Cognatiyoonia sediminum]SHG66832.1 2-Methylisocitrate lyase, PEP mutase family [Cognatiyoonia sediminum]